jgi:hypothetical protein
MSPPLGPNLNQMNPVHKILPCSSRIDYNIILPSVPRFSKLWFSYSRFSMSLVYLSDQLCMFIRYDLCVIPNEFHNTFLIEPDSSSYSQKPVSWRLPWVSLTQSTTWYHTPVTYILIISLKLHLSLRHDISVLCFLVCMCACYTFILPFLIVSL